MNLKKITACAAVMCAGFVFAQDYDVVKAVSEKMAAVEGSVFDMGSTGNEKNELPVHKVTVSSFYISSTEVTQKEYEAVTGENLSANKGENLPVEEVSWYDALVFCNKLSIMSSLTPVYSINGTTDPEKWGAIPRIDSSDEEKSVWNKAALNPLADGYRLPTEAEWEFAAKGGIKDTPSIYSGSSTSAFVAWNASTSGDATHDVAKKNANELGLYDMTGNVWEWCWDWYGNYPKEDVKDPLGEKEEVTGRKIRRGGSIKSADVFCRNENRATSVPELRGVDLGFRVARSVVSGAPAVSASASVPAESAAPEAAVPVSEIVPASEELSASDAVYASVEEDAFIDDTAGLSK